MKHAVNLNSDNSEKVPYRNEDFPVYMRRGLISHSLNHAIVSHWHNDLEFIAVLSGEMNCCYADKSCLLTAGNGIFINSRQLHCGYSQARRECEFICVLMHPMLLCSNFWLEKNFVLPLIQNTEMKGIPLFQNIAWHQTILENLKAIYESRENPLLIQSAYFQIADALFSHLPAVRQTQSRGDDSLSVLRSMIGFIQRNYVRKISLEQIAAAGNVCRSTCCAIFRKHLHQTPINHLIQYRLRKSSELLQTTDMTVAEIGDAVGFSNPSYYAEMFHRHAGCSPSQYREKVGKAPGGIASPESS